MACSFRTTVSAGLVACATGCGSEPSSTARCPEVGGEFPPTACAFVSGRLTAQGAPIPGAGLRVDEFHPTIGYAYSSGAAATDASGHFELLVFRINEFRPPFRPDTATVYVNLYANEGAATPGASPQDSFPVQMAFAPLGTPVDTTEAELTMP